jgi:hypothetical protein
VLAVVVRLYFYIPLSMKATITISLLFALLLSACYLDIYEIGNSSSSYYSSDSLSSPSSSSSRKIELLDSLHCDGQSYKIVEMDTQTWMAQNINEIPKAGNYWCYGGFEENCDIYGKLYDWEAAMSVCPDGWKLPSKEDFENLSKYEDVLNATSVWHTIYAGLKYEEEDRGYDFREKEGYWWSSTESGKFAHYRQIIKGDSRLRSYDVFKTRGFSVRCIKK